MFSIDDVVIMLLLLVVVRHKLIYSIHQSYFIGIEANMILPQSQIEVLNYMGASMVPLSRQGDLKSSVWNNAPDVTSFCVSALKIDSMAESKYFL